jgi:hypothetical protein
LENLDSVLVERWVLHLVSQKVAQRGMMKVVM